MKNNIDTILLAALIAVISAGGVALYYINKSGGAALTATPSSSATSVYRHPSLSGNVAAFAPGAVEYQNFAMPEPFAATAPFEFTPVAWMQMMNNMMNNLQMTQMMHQMAAMPSQMMNPMMQMNPHSMLPNQTINPSQQLMDPKEYKKWYEQQQKLQQSEK